MGRRADPPEVALTRAQASALDHVRKIAARSEPPAGADVAAAIESLKRNVQVVLAFHPERITRFGRTVIQGLLEDGRYRNQFETGVSSGSTSAVPGGRRDRWERDLFGGAYHGPGVPVSERPTYGAMLLVDHPDGPAPRFGSCYFILDRKVSTRCSFTPQGSQERNAASFTGTLDHLHPVLRRLKDHFDESTTPLGLPELSFERFLNRVEAGLPLAADVNPEDPNGRALDSFVEAQVHGSIDLERDVESLTADSCFRGSALEGDLCELAAKYGMPLQWHPGFELEPGEFPNSFRGLPTRVLAERVARNDVVDALALGLGQNDFLGAPQSWPDLGTEREALTSFRRVWHFLVLEGRPSKRWNGPGLAPGRGRIRSRGSA